MIGLRLGDLVVFECGLDRRRVVDGHVDHQVGDLPRLGVGDRAGQAATGGSACAEGAGLIDQLQEGLVGGAPVDARLRC